MLSLNKKIKIFKSILNQEEVSYADSFNGLIFIFSQNSDFQFLEKLNSKSDIENWIKRLKSIIVMREDDATFEDILDEYILF